MADIVVQFNHFPQIADQLDKALSKVVKATAFKAQANIQSQIQANGQIDTGFMMNSVYAVTSDGSTYSGGEHALPEVEAPPDNKTAYVAVGALYGIYQNYGTRYLPPRPFFEPGIEATQPDFEAALSAIESQLG